ncbi:MAG: DUF309 domain-containing protein [Thermoanaerobaculia bacterium]|nr:DUF309 domain-containing protein [Thermoanaerobaculia bacterium]
MKPFTQNFLRGIAHFNSLEFWEAHESWEELWLVAESDIEQFLQGLIQVAAAYHHLKRGTFRGGVRLFDSALKRLEAFPPDHCGLDRIEVESAARKHREWAASCESEARLRADEYPRLHLARGEAGVVPPITAW